VGRTPSSAAAWQWSPAAALLSPSSILFRRPYLYTAYAAGGTGLAYALAKALCFVYGPIWPAQAAIIGVFGMFSWIHVLAARNAVAWARKRTALGLASFPWEPALQDRLLPGR
jgi:hypothetical protein